MGETFVFSNFAVSTLLYELGSSETTLSLITDDAWRFPANLGGAKVPCVISDDSREPEIVYITVWDPETGLAIVERGREGTTAKNWLAGTLVRHTLTAETFQAIARVTPQGQWVDDLQYVAGDLVLNNGISYIAVRPNIDSEPIGAGNADWQALYIPPGEGTADKLYWLGPWSNATTYASGAVVVYKGTIWSAMSGSTNVEPSWTAPQWQPLAPWAGPHRNWPVLTASGTGNYNVSLAPDDNPAAIYDGMMIRIRISNDNTTDACVLTVGGMGPWPLRVRTGVESEKSDWKANEIYELGFNGAVGEWLPVLSPEMQRRLKLGDDLDVLYKGMLVADKKTTWGIGDADPVYADPAAPDWPYPEATRGTLEERLEKIERALGLYRKDTTGIEPDWDDPWEPKETLVDPSDSTKGKYPAGSVLWLLWDYQRQISANYDHYEKHAITNIKKVGKKLDYQIAPNDSTDVGLGEFLIGMHENGAGRVDLLHSMQLRFNYVNGNEGTVSGS